MADLPSGDGPVDPSYGDIEGQHVRSASGSVMLWCLIPIGAVVLFVIVTVMMAASLSGSDASTPATERGSRKLAPHWIVKSGQTYTQIADKTGLSIDQLEAFNPRVDPSTIAAGQRIRLRPRVPSPPPKRSRPR